MGLGVSKLRRRKLSGSRLGWREVNACIHGSFTGWVKSDHWVGSSCHWVGICPPSNMLAEASGNKVKANVHVICDHNDLRRPLCILI